MINIIVIIQIISLSGVEGKMFRPMALTFSFALIGAMILCFTYVPVASAMFLRPQKKSRRNISERLMNFIHSLYAPSIELAMRYKKMVLGGSLILLLFSVYIYNTMGGEFVPVLDEGDFVIQPVLKTGTSLGATIEMTTRIEKILLDNFPEVEQVVSRIGAAEVPTDPMSMEESDIIIKLKPKSEWVSAKNKNELAEKFVEALSVIPGVEYEFTQPIEMRFNELITGVRADIAIKVFGEDLEVLNRKGNEIKAIVEGVPGASDVILEKTAGLPQMTVSYNRQQIAKYGLTIKELNDMIRIGFAGTVTGSVFEGEKRFDLVVRFDGSDRKNIKDIEDLRISLPNGRQIPITEVANVAYTQGPAKISRDDTKRRIVVGVNVRNRDLQSVVEDIKIRIDQHIKLPPGYYIDYGGQYENLQSAGKRLKLAVPIALLLIFIFLHFAFKSFRQALMIFSAIPLSAVGGVLLLWIRGLPFSISAGVGFIALFGIAVLNGIVLIEHFKDLKSKGVTDVQEQVILAAKQRLRPVLLTAAAAAMGFLPMAISTSAGAEVQRPLATVVIGGLISATFLTMIVLPVLFVVVDKFKFSFLRSSRNKIAGLLILFFIVGSLNAQNKELKLEQAIDLALANNLEYQAALLEAEHSKKLIGTSFDLDKTGIYYNYDQSNIAANDLPLSIFGITQDFEFPTIYNRQKRVGKAEYSMKLTQTEIVERDISNRVAQQFNLVVYLQNKLFLYSYLDSLYQHFSVAAERRYELGETNYLETLTAKSKRNQLLTNLSQLKLESEAALSELAAIIQVDSIFDISIRTLIPQLLDTSNWSAVPGSDLMVRQSEVMAEQIRLEKSRFLPGFQLEYFLSTNDGPKSKSYNAYQIGVSLPLWFKPQQNRVAASRIQHDIALNMANDYNIRLHYRKKQLLSSLKKHEEAVTYYQMTGKKLATEITRMAEKAYYNGEIDYFQYIQSLENATSIAMDYLDNLVQYNTIIYEIKYLNL